MEQVRSALLRLSSSKTPLEKVWVPQSPVETSAHNPMFVELRDIEPHMIAELTGTGRMVDEQTCQVSTVATTRPMWFSVTVLVVVGLCSLFYGLVVYLALECDALRNLLFKWFVTPEDLGIPVVYDDE